MLREVFQHSLSPQIEEEMNSITEEAQKTALTLEEDSTISEPQKRIRRSLLNLSKMSEQMVEIAKRKKSS